jgi:exosome complex exonuclease RRP6
MATSDEVAVTSVTDTTGDDGAMAEIPFVPAALRQTVKAEVVDEAIVVVGQRQKKHKRNKKAGIGGEDSSESLSAPAAHTKVEPEEVVPFDFASVPNILGDASSDRCELEDERVGNGKRLRSKKGKVPPILLRAE